MSSFDSCSILCLLLLATIVASCSFTTVVDAAGFNSKRIAYVQFSRAVAEATSRQKPIMLIIHKSWCPACKQLRKKFEQSPEIEALAEYFVMADAEDDDEPSDEKYAPNGSYSPRILFLDPSGDVLPVTNPVGTDPASPHFYGSAAEVVKGMVAALHHTSGIHHLDEL